MFIVLYRWRVKPEMHAQFIEGWSEMTAYYRENFDSLGSRLHRGGDGLFYAYAQWKSAEQRERAFRGAPPDWEARRKVGEATEEFLPEIVLESVSDYLILPPEI